MAFVRHAHTRTLNIDCHKIESLHIAREKKLFSVLHM